MKIVCYHNGEDKIMFDTNKDYVRIASGRYSGEYLLCSKCANIRRSKSKVVLEEMLDEIIAAEVRGDSVFEIPPYAVPPDRYN